MRVLRVWAATKKKLVRRSSVRLPVPALIFAAKSLFNASPTPSIVVCTIVMHARDVLYDCIHSHVRDVTRKSIKQKIYLGGGKLLK